MVAERLVPDRFRRVWAMVAVIAEEPGHTRSSLAARFHLSARQTQADLRLIRDRLRLPLVRERGYRFAGEGAAVGLTMREALALVTVLRHASRQRAITAEQVAALVAKLPALVPPHLQSLLSTLLAGLVHAPGRDRHVVEALSTGLLRGASVKLHHAAPVDPERADGTLLRPELLLPYDGAWYVVGEEPARTLGYPSRMRMLPLAGIEAVTLAEVSS